MARLVNPQYKAFLGKVWERFPDSEEMLPPDLMQFYLERPDDIRTAITVGLAEHRKKVVEAEKAAEEKRRASKRVLLAQVTEPVAGMEIDFGDGWYFTIDEVVEYEVDFALTTTALLKLMGCNRADWKDLGTAPKGGTRMVKSVIGRFNKRWTENGIVALIAQPGCRFKGSGAWVREGFIKFRPKYDGKGWICFVGDPNSRWQSVRGGLVCFPCLSSDDADSWRRCLGRVGCDWRSDYRLCFLWE